MFGEHGRKKARHLDRPPPTGLRRPDVQAAGFAHRDRDVDGSDCKVQSVDPETPEFAGAKSAVGGEVHSGSVPLVDDRGERVHLVGGEESHLPMISIAGERDLRER